MGSARVQVTIDELSLTGFPEFDHVRVGETIEVELARLLSERGIPDALTAGWTAERIQGPSIPAQAGRDANDWGGEVAAAIYEGLGG